MGDNTISDGKRQTENNFEWYTLVVQEIRVQWKKVNDGDTNAHAKRRRACEKNGGVGGSRLQVPL